MALPAKPTLGALRSELLARLGYGAQGAGANNLVANALQFLQQAQEYLYWEVHFNELKLLQDFTTVKGYRFYDYGHQVHPDNIMQIRVLFSGIWHPLREGVHVDHDTSRDNRDYPRRYDRRAQLELWPESNGEYPVRVEHYQRLGRFSEENDRCTVDDFLLFNLALAHGKEHYGHEDFNTYYTLVEHNLRRRRRRTHGNKRYVVGKLPEYPMLRPSTVNYR